MIMDARTHSNGEVDGRDSDATLTRFRSTSKLIPVTGRQFKIRLMFIRSQNDVNSPGRV